MSKFNPSISMKLVEKRPERFNPPVETNEKTTSSFIEDLPPTFKLSTVILSASAFIASMVITIAVLAPDSKDLQRSMELNQQYSEIESKIAN